METHFDLPPTLASSAGAKRGAPLQLTQILNHSPTGQDRYSFAVYMHQRSRWALPVQGKHLAKVLW